VGHPKGGSVLERHGKVYNKDSGAIMTETLQTGQILAQHDPINSARDATTSALLLAGPRGLDTAPLASILMAAGLSKWHENMEASTPGIPLRVFENSDALARASEVLAEQPEAMLLLTYPAPVPFIARALTAEAMPQEGLTRWLEQAEPILEVYRRARRRIVLVEHAAALANPQALIAQLIERFDLPLKSDRIAPEQTAETTESDFDPVHLLIADCACQQDARARRAAAELEVSSLPLSSGGIRESIDLEFTLRNYRQKSEEPLKQATRIQEQNEQLHNQLQQVQAQFQSLQEANAQNPELEEENELLLMQLHQVQEELESYFLENKDLEGKLKSTDQEKKKFERKARQATNMLKDVHASLSWKITAPIRLLLRPFLGK
jgi:hypothetical protein